MKRFLIIFIFLFFVCAPISHAEEITGIIPGQIWYSQDSFKEGDTVKIYTAIWNNNKENLTTKVEFYDKNVILGTREITILPYQVSGAYVSWKVTSGDHTISAKIISSTLINNGTKGAIVLNRVTTNEDKKFVPAVVTNLDGTPATSSDVVKSQIDKANSKIAEVIPDSVSKPVSGFISTVDKFKEETFVKIEVSKNKAKAQIAELEKKVTSVNSAKQASSTDKPIAYLKLFFLSIVYFIFGNKLIFYGLIILISFFVLRYLYLKLRYR